MENEAIAKERLARVREVRKVSAVTAVRDALDRAGASYRIRTQTIQMTVDVWFGKGRRLSFTAGYKKMSQKGAAEEAVRSALEIRDAAEAFGHRVKIK